MLHVSDAVEGVVTLTLDRPDKRNALSIALRDAISDALDALAVDERVRCVVVTGNGPVFSAGFDLAEMQVADAEHQARLWASADRYHRTVLEFPLPTVAALNGLAIAGGFDLAVLCDLRVAADTVRFAHPEHQWTDVVYGPLHDLVGGAVARDLCLTGREVDAAEALRLGLVTRVVARDELTGVVDELTARIASAPRELVMRTKAKALARARLRDADGRLAL